MIQNYFKATKVYVALGTVKVEETIADQVISRCVR